MINQELIEKLSVLSSRIDSLPVNYRDSWSTALLEKQNGLVDLYNKAVLKDLQGSDENYQLALEQINKAIDIIGEGNKKVDQIEKVVDIISKAIELAGKAVGIATHL